MFTNINHRAIRSIVLLGVWILFVTVVGYYSFRIEQPDNKAASSSSSELSYDSMKFMEEFKIDTRKNEMLSTTAIDKNVVNIENNGETNVEATMKMEQFEKINVMATGYTAGVESTGKTPNHPEYGITFSGVRVKRDPDALSTIAADINVFPLGTILYIPGYGYGVVADTGSAIKGHRIDLYYETVEDVYKEWGKKSVDVYIIQRGNGKLTDALMEQYKQVAATM